MLARACEKEADMKSCTTTLCVLLLMATISLMMGLKTLPTGVVRTAPMQAGAMHRAKPQADTHRTAEMGEMMTAQQWLKSIGYD